MAEQLVFDLPVRPAMGRDDFFVTGSNAAALAQVDGWRDWPFGKLVLVGPEGAGKTHLAHVWAAQSGARIIAASEVDEAEILRADATPAIAVEAVDRVAGERDARRGSFTCTTHMHSAARRCCSPRRARRPAGA
jgi:hypothetical protein